MSMNIGCIDRESGLRQGWKCRNARPALLAPNNQSLAPLAHLGFLMRNATFERAQKCAATASL